MSGPTTACVRCNKATPLVGCWGYNEWGDMGELCRECQPNRFVNPHHVQEAAAAHREAVRLLNHPDFAKWETEIHSGVCRSCGSPSDWADSCSSCGNGGA